MLYVGVVLICVSASIKTCTPTARQELFTTEPACREFVDKFTEDLVGGGMVGAGGCFVVQVPGRDT